MYFCGVLILPPEIPLQPIDNELIRLKGVSLNVLRLDTIELYSGGNKFFKLKYNLEEALKSGASRLLTFGGAWSNHLAAVATVMGKGSAVSEQIKEVIAVIRGEEPRELSKTLRFCKEKGLKLHFVSRSDYREKTEDDFISGLKKQFGDFFLLPEGGSNALAVKGCAEIPGLIKQDFDIICCPVGSGGTLAGITAGLHQDQKALGYVALKNGHYLQETVFKLGADKTRFNLLHDFHFGGFAKTSPELLSFKRSFEKEQGFLLDFVYTSKMFFGIFEMLKNDAFPPGTRLVAIHTGGLQGNAGFE